MKIDLIRIFDILLSEYGKQYWWPADTTDEMMIGAILTQNTSWTNVEKAIKNLKEKELCSLVKLSNSVVSIISELIKPSGYYNVKAKRLINFAKKLNIQELIDSDLLTARKILLSINGIGPETADSILLYAFQKEVFVIDAYTIRLFKRFGLVLNKYTYDELQHYIMTNLPAIVSMFNEYHALIVKHCKVSCKVRPECDNCCLNTYCEKIL